MSIKTINYALSLFINYKNWYRIICNRLLDITTNSVVLRNGLKIVGSDNSQLMEIVDEVFIRQVYNPNNFEIKKGDTVVDVGSNIGIFSLYAAMHGARKVIAVEPLKENIEIAKRNFINNKILVNRILNFAVSDRNGFSKLYLNEHDSHGMLFNKVRVGMSTEHVMVKTFKFSTFLKKHKIKKIDFLKIDCEGSEGYIFSDMDSVSWRNIKKMSIEYHNGVSILNHKQIIERLNRHGYHIRHLSSDDQFGYIYAWR